MEDRVTGNQCKYSKERLAQIIRDRGVTAAIDEIDPKAVGDTELRKLWERVHNDLNHIEELVAL